MNQERLKRFTMSSAAVPRESWAARLARRAAADAQLMDSICAALAEEAESLGFDPSSMPFSKAALSLSVDPVSGEESLMGDWFNARGQHTGAFVIHADGSFYAEREVVRRHPSDPCLVVEAVTAWGCCDAIRAEARMLHAS